MAYYILKSYKLKLLPYKIFEILSREKNCFFLDSSLNSGYAPGRFSFLGSDPFLIVKTNGLDPFKKIREAFKLYNLSRERKEVPFSGGAVGYFAYDLGFGLERKLKKRQKKDLGIPDCFLAFYNTIIIIDHFKKVLSIFSVGFPERKSRYAKALARDNFKKIFNLLSKRADSGASRADSSMQAPELKSNFTKEEYMRAVKKAKEYIRRGDIYQVNLSQEFNARLNLPAFEIYRRLRVLSPSYFSAYFDTGDFQILSSSPEMFLRLENNRVITRPMKGTRPRSQNRIKDLKLRKELLASRKDKAELTMIVDLERNDLGKVCNYESIKVDKLRELEKYNTVFQTTATVSGRLHKDKDRVDLLRACFPGGSITGCPKIRAMEIIEELEPGRRSVYTGSFGYLSFCGDMHLNILIRTILKKGDKLYFGAGGGIVADSDPEDEYEETLVKAKAMAKAIG